MDSLHCVSCGVYMHMECKCTNVHIMHKTHILSIYVPMCTYCIEHTWSIYVHMCTYLHRTLMQWNVYAHNTYTVQCIYMMERTCTYMYILYRAYTCRVYTYKTHTLSCLHSWYSTYLHTHRATHRYTCMHEGQRGTG